ncbi:MAG: sialate O-acetylesterase [Fuerstiella sp.]
MIRMKMYSKSVLVFVCLLQAKFTFADEPQILDLVIVAGQSNAVGYDAKPSELPADASDREVLFWWRTGDPPPDEHDSSSNHQWTHLQVQYLGNPIKPRRDRQYGNFAQADGGFGPEIGFAREWQKRHQQKLAIVKTAFSGTGLGKDWDPKSDSESGACFRTMVSEIQAAVAAAELKNLKLRPRAILWVQGESDANEIDAPLYAKRLQQMLAELRKQLNAPDLKALVAVNTRFQQGKNKFMPAIVQAQRDCAAAGPLCRYVDTSEASIANAAHFDTAGTLMVGRLFAENLLAFDNADATVNPVSP